MIFAFSFIMLAVSPFAAFKNQAMFSQPVHAASSETEDFFRPSDSFQSAQWLYHQEAENIPALQSYVKDGKIDVIVGFKDEHLFGLIGEVTRLKQRSDVRNLGGKVEHDFTIINALSARIPLQAVEALSRNSKVSFIEPNYQLTIMTQYMPWGTDRVFGPEKYPFATWNYSTGQGIGIAVLDTGIDREHIDLPAISGGFTVIDNSDYGVDDHGHGTHVAGTISALDNDLGVVGISPAVGLYSVKVMDASGKGTYACLINGIEWADQNNIPIINMSLGGSSYSLALKNAVDVAYDNGALLIASAGNGGQSTDNVLYPARFESVIAVSAANANNGISSISSSGPSVELIAPGENILSTLPGDKLGYASGTSMAAPHVAASAALIWSADSNLTNLEVRYLLRNTAEDLGLPKDHQGYGMVRTDLAVAELIGNDLDPGKDASLADLSVSTGTLKPAFTPGETDYSLVVDHDLEALDITAVLSDAENASMTINGQAQLSGEVRTITLEPAGQETLVTIRVTAEDEVTEKVYTISIERSKKYSSDASLADLSVSNGTLKPAFTPGETDYSLVVDPDLGALDITAVLSDAENASMTITGQAQLSGETKTVQLNAAGSETLITIKVIAEDGITNKVYRINVSKAEAPAADANLSALKISNGMLEPAFKKDILYYQINIDHDVESVSITATLSDKNATLQIKGQVVKSGEAKEVTLGDAGAKTAIELVVTAQDGETKKTYSITVNRSESPPPPKEKYTITLSTEPEEGGSVSGAGIYEEGKTSKVEALANEGYEFVNWTENGSEISTDSSFTFTATRDWNLLANFKEVNKFVPPATPNLSWPVHGEYVDGSSVTLNWFSLKEATNYMVWVINLTTDELLYYEMIEETTFTVEGLPDNGDFIGWSVVGGDGANGLWGDFAVPRIFKSGTDEALYPPTLTSPEDGANISGTSVELEWAISPNAEVYNVAILNNTTGELFDYIALVTGTSVTVEGLPDNGDTFLWTVVAGSAKDGWSEFAFPRTFVNE